MELYHHLVYEDKTILRSAHKHNQTSYVLWGNQDHVDVIVNFVFDIYKAAVFPINLEVYM